MISWILRHEGSALLDVPLPLGLCERMAQTRGPLSSNRSMIEHDSMVRTMMGMVAVVVALQLSSLSTAKTSQHRDTLSTASLALVSSSRRALVHLQRTNEPDDEEYLPWTLLNIEIGESSIIADERLGFVDEPHSTPREWYAWRAAIAIIAIVR